MHLFVFADLQIVSEAAGAAAVGACCLGIARGSKRSCLCVFNDISTTSASLTPPPPAGNTYGNRDYRSFAGGRGTYIHSTRQQESVLCCVCALAAFRRRLHLELPPPRQYRLCRSSAVSCAAINSSFAPKRLSVMSRPSPRERAGVGSWNTLLRFFGGGGGYWRR